MKYKYDITVIMPVFNVEEYVEESINSVINQTYDFDKIELILINDASTDNSSEICKQHAEKFSNIKFYNNKENHGVSYSRNLGIKEATGKYILMLDSDDTISNCTIKNVLNFFNQHYDDVDLVTYPLTYDINGKRNSSKKYKMFDKGTNVYDLEEYPYMEQSGVNIIFKNTKDIFYDEKMQISEDHKFNTETLMKKQKIGFCSEAEYIYRRSDSGLFMTKANPYYCFEYVLSYNEYLVNKFQKNGKIPKYIQGIILSTINWRLDANQLLPYHYSGAQYDDAIERMKKIARHLDVETIINDPILPLSYKYFVFKAADKKVKIISEDNQYKIIIDNVEVLSSKYVNVFMNHFKLSNDKLQMMGYFYTGLHQYIKPNLYICYTDSNNLTKEEKIDLFLSNNSYNIASIKTNDFYGFKYNIDLSKIKKFHFYTIIDDKKYLISFKFSEWSQFNSSIGRYRLIGQNIILSFNNKEKIFSVLPKNIKNTLLLPLKEIKKYGLKNPKILIYRYIAKKKKNIWLYSDSKGIYNNGYDQFKHDFNKKDGIKRYYIYHNSVNSTLEKFTEEERKYLVKFGSFKHKKLYLQSSMIITSFGEYPDYSPIGKSYKYYSDLLNYKVIYLQHGILHASLITMYSKEYTEIDKIVISSQFELKNLQEKYHYDKNDLIVCGMPRMNSQEKRNINSKKIVFAPSWRVYLIGKSVKGQRKDTPDIFLKSNYYIKINNFLNSNALKKLLNENDMTLEFKLHPIFRGYKDLFNFSSERINISFDEIDPKEYAIFITDFSSFQFDFAKLGIPIIYFLPDENEFRSGLHSYRELDLKYEDAFGNLCLDDKKLLKELESIIKNKCLPEKKYLSRMNNFFITSENPCEDIYQTLIKNEEEIK